MDQLSGLSSNELNNFNRSQVIDENMRGTFYDKLGKTEAKVMEYIAHKMNLLTDAVIRNNVRIESTQDLLVNNTKQVEELRRDLTNVNGELLELGLRTSDLRDNRTISNIKNSISALENRINDFNINDIQTQLRELQERLQQTQPFDDTNILSRINNLSAEIDALKQLKSTLGEEDIRKIETSIKDEASKAIQSIKNDIDNKATQDELNQLNKQFNELSRQVENGNINDQTFIEFRKKFVELTDKLDRINSKIEEQDNNIRSVSEDTIRTEQFGKWKDEMSSRFSESNQITNNRVDELKDNISRLSEQNTINSEKLADWERQIALFTEESRNLKDQFTQNVATSINREEFEKWKKDLMANNSQISDERLQQVDAKIQSIMSNASETQAKLDKWKQELSDETKSISATEVSKMKKELDNQFQKDLHNLGQQVESVNTKTNDLSQLLETKDINLRAELSDIKNDIEKSKKEFRDAIVELRKSGISKETTQEIKNEVEKLIKDIKVSSITDEELQKRISAATRNLNDLESQLMNDITLRLMRGLMIRQFYNSRTKMSSWLFNWLP